MSEPNDVEEVVKRVEALLVHAFDNGELGDNTEDAIMTVAKNTCREHLE